MFRSVVLSVVFLQLAPVVFGTVYLPGVIPNAFKDEEKVSCARSFSPYHPPR